MSKEFDNKIAHIRNALAHDMITTAEAERLGVSRQRLQQLVQSGEIERIAHGLHRLPGTPTSAETTIAEVSRLVPGGVICLLSALRLHGLTAQLPVDVWIAIENGVWNSTRPDLPMRIVEMREPSFSSGIEHRMIDNVSVPIYSAAKTIADCFKFRNKIGLDVAIEALRDGLRQKVVTVDDIWHYSKICRVANVIRPYIEAIQ